MFISIIQTILFVLCCIHHFAFWNCHGNFPSGSQDVTPGNHNNYYCHRFSHHYWSAHFLWSLPKVGGIYPSPSFVTPFFDSENSRSCYPQFTYLFVPSWNTHQAIQNCWSFFFFLNIHLAVWGLRLGLVVGSQLQHTGSSLQLVGFFVAARRLSSCGARA